MPRLKLRNFNKISDFLKKLPRFFAENAFLASLTLIFIALIFGALAFYKYSFLAEEKEPEVLQKPALLNAATLQEILKIREERQKRFEAAESKEYPDPFRID